MQHGWKARRCEAGELHVRARFQRASCVTLHIPTSGRAVDDQMHRLKFWPWEPFPCRHLSGHL